MKRTVALSAVLLVALAGCSSSEEHKKPGGGSTTSSSAKGCTASAAKDAARVTITKAGLDRTCVKVARKKSFTLVNADATAHDFSTKKGAPSPLRVQLKKGASFPYRFTKAGTYTLDDAKSDLVLTIIVG